MKDFTGNISLLWVYTYRKEKKKKQIYDGSMRQAVWEIRPGGISTLGML